jgi:hypothetical protein
MDSWNTIVWHQFGAAIDSLDAAIAACPSNVWDDPDQDPWRRFWYGAFHALFFLDFYLSPPGSDFHPPAPFTMSEADPRGVLPPRTYTKEELREYLQHGRRKCRATLEAMTDEQARARYVAPWGEMSVAELLLYSMRHVQHHTAQLNWVLRDRTGAATPWVVAAKGS